MEETQRGTVIEVTETEATVAMEDGSTRVVSIPSIILIEVGMPVTITDLGDGKPIYGWGD